MASTTRKPRQTAAEKAAAKAALDANAPAVVAEKLTQPDNGLTTSDEQSAAEATEQVAPALAERRRIAAEAKQKREAEKAAVAARAEQVAAEQAANPAPAKAKKGPTPEQEAARKAQAERVERVVQMRKDGKKLGEIAAELGYSSQQVVSSVLRRHAPDLQVKREAGTGGLALTPEQVTELTELEARYGAKLATITKALARATAPATEG